VIDSLERDGEGKGAPAGSGVSAPAPVRAAAEDAAVASVAAEALGEEAGEGSGVRVSLESFEGPLDLLLFLIKRDEIEITDIPIAHITEQFLESIQDLSVVDLDRAGEYLLMAATLMRIKSRLLLPRAPEDELEDEDEEDPRRELARRILEYREFKRVAELLGEREGEWRQVFRRASSPIPEFEPEEVGDLGVDLLDLVKAFRGILEKASRSEVFALDAEEYSVEEQIEFVRRECSAREEGVAFRQLFSEGWSRGLLITTFLALLEMMRRGEIRVTQASRFGEIWLKKGEGRVAHGN
jgi:segregation and condensation protein A